MPSKLFSLSNDINLIDHSAASKMAPSGKEKPTEIKNYRGFVAGVFSGIAKLSGE